MYSLGHYNATRDINDVIRRANATRYGPAARVFIGSLETANTMMRVLKAGIVWINCFDVFDAAIPFRGYKLSAIGREKGIYSLNNYLQVKAGCCFSLEESCLVVICWVLGEYGTVDGKFSVK
ncbi:hypothetical protein Q3G72_013932 [Acer saccharum]|nr:hypothetical protein Q3G72_013932 [Acer saccharum]